MTNTLDGARRELVGEPTRSMARPEKEFMYARVRRALEDVRVCDTVVDLACGAMVCAKWVTWRRYIGVDLVDENLRAGLKEHPSAVAICARIEDLPSDVTGDLVLCLQCIGINQFFDAANTMTCVTKCIDATRTGGRLIFNMGPKSHAYFAEVEEQLRNRFEAIEVVKYGRFPEHRPIRMARVIASVMSHIPALARHESSGARRLFVCARKRTAG